MIKSRHISTITAICMAAAVVFTLFFTYAPQALPISAAASQPSYAEKLFDKDALIEIDIRVDDSQWQEMLDNATAEEYVPCNLVINGDTFSTVGVRPKGNTSLSQVASSGSERFSFKFEFDHYIDGQTCYGLDKFVVNNIASDATYMKEYLSYDLMNHIGVDTPLYAFAKISVNGEYWGLYLAIEAVEESFVERVYGSQDGNLYKPDSMDMGGMGGGMPQDDKEAGNFGGRFQKDNDQGAPSQGENTQGNADPGGEESGIQAEDGSGDQSHPSSESGGVPHSSQTPPEGGMGSADGQDGAPGERPDAPAGDATAGFGGEQNAGGAPADTAAPENLPQALSGNGETIDGNLSGDNGSSALPDTAPEEGGTPVPGTENGFPAMGGGFGGMGGGGADLKYTDDEISSYSTIFDSAVFDSSEEDCQRVIEALKKLNEGTDLESAVDVDGALRYIAANAVLVNLDSYFGTMQHNYYLYEEDGQLCILPWDYNLSFGAFQSSDASAAVNFPIDTPVSGTTLEDRPLIGKLLEVEEYLETYHSYLREIVNGYFMNGTFENTIEMLHQLIGEEVKNDPTAFYTYEEYTEAVEMLKNYGTLRALSVDGQLSGSIPSTTAGQKADSSSLVDASAIDLTVMGTQGGMGGGRGEMAMARPGDSSQQKGGAEEPSPGGQPSDGAEEAPDNGENQSFAIPGGDVQMPDNDTMGKVLEIVGDGTGELSEEQRGQLLELGLTEEEITLAQQMLRRGTNSPSGGGDLLRAGQTPAGGRGDGAVIEIAIAAGGALLVLIATVFVAMKKRRRDVRR